MSENQEKSSRKITTSQFGEIEIPPKYIFYFEEGLLGFDDLREFALISEEETEPFKWLISLEEPEIGFPLLNPWLINPSYSPNKKFDLSKEAALVVVTLENELGKITANMKAPIVFNTEKNTAEQIILPSEKYSPVYEIKLESSSE